MWRGAAARACSGGSWRGAVALAAFCALHVAGALPLYRSLLEGQREDRPTQVHLGVTGTPSELLVLWATAGSPDGRLARSVSVELSTSSDRAAPVTTVYGGAVSSYTQLQFYDTGSLLQPDMDEVGATVSKAELCRLLAVPEHLGGLPPNCSASTRLLPQFGIANNPDHVYSSPTLVSVTLQNLKASTQYFYRVSGDSPNTLRAFTTLPPHATHADAFPVAFAVFADVGQTVVSAANIAMLADDPETRLVLLAGDLSYADGVGERWDTWGELMSMLLESRPLAAAVGNHELERGESGVAMLARYPSPYVAAKSSSPYDYSFDAGPAHVVVLNSYPGARGATRQVAWLRAALARVDRRRTPWLVCMFHTAWYSSNNAKAYRNAGEPLRWATEEILAAAGVDIIVSGHVHHYERTFPVINRTREACGPVHLNVGAAGARGGPMIGFRVPAPDWSAFRQASFGAGTLKLVNETHAFWSWTRVACASAANVTDPYTPWAAIWDAERCASSGDNSEVAHEPKDEAWIVRDVLACTNKRGYGV